MDRGANRSIAERSAGAALVVADDLGVDAELLDVGRVEASDDRHPLTRLRDEESPLPGAVRAGDQIEAGIGSQQRLADEREPEVGVLLAEDLDRLVELLAHELPAGSHERTLPADL